MTDRELYNALIDADATCVRLESAILLQAPNALTPADRIEILENDNALFAARGRFLDLFDCVDERGGIEVLYAQLGYAQ